MIVAFSLVKTTHATRHITQSSQCTSLDLAGSLLLRDGLSMLIVLSCIEEFLLIKCNGSQRVNHLRLVHAITQRDEDGLRFLVVTTRHAEIATLPCNITHDTQGPPFATAHALLAKERNGIATSLFREVKFALVGIHDTLAHKYPGLSRT